MDRASIAEALKEAHSIVDEVMPCEGLPPNRSLTDRAELRKVALRLILAALLDQPPGPGHPPVPAAGQDEGHGEDMLTTSEAARMLGLSAGGVYDWERRGLLASVRTPAGHRRYRRADIAALAASDYAQRSAQRRNLDAGMEDIARMRTEDGLSWPEIAAKTGMSRTAAQARFNRWAARQLASAPGKQPRS